MIKRSILPSLEKELSTKEVIVLTGMRQTGKTTILKYLFERTPSTNKVLLDLENPLNRKLFEEEHYDNIWRNVKQLGITNKEKAYFFLDEIQNVRTLPSVVKYLYDHWQVKFILTGSSSYYLKNLFSESLSSRKLVYELFPLTFDEFLIFMGEILVLQSTIEQKAQEKSEIAYQRKIRFYDEYMRSGGFPAIVLEENPDRRQKLLEQVFTSYFEIDVKSLADVRDSTKLRDLILLLVPRIGSKIDVSKLSSELEVTRETLYNYLAFLERTYIINLLPQYTKSIDRQAAGAKKLYFCDSGLASYLGRLSEGQLFEQSVFQTLRPKDHLSYFQKKKKEIDFITSKDIALEVKRTASSHDIAFLKKQSESLGITRSYVVTYFYSKLPDTIPATEL